MSLVYIWALGEECDISPGQELSFGSTTEIFSRTTGSLQFQAEVANRLGTL